MDIMVRLSVGVLCNKSEGLVYVTTGNRVPKSKGALDYQCSLITLPTGSIWVLVGISTKTGRILVGMSQVQDQSVIWIVIR